MPSASLPSFSAQHHLLDGFSQQLQTIGPLGTILQKEEPQDLIPWQQYYGSLETCEVPASPTHTNPSLQVSSDVAEWEELQTLGKVLTDHA